MYHLLDCDSDPGKDEPPIIRFLFFIQFSVSVLLLHDKRGGGSEQDIPVKCENRRVSIPESQLYDSYLSSSGRSLPDQGTVCAVHCTGCAVVCVLSDSCPGLPCGGVQRMDKNTVRSEQYIL